MRVLIVGDSQAAGPVGRDVESALRSAGHNVQRIAYVGHGAHDWTRMHWPEYEAALATLRPEHVILIFGGNDPPDARLEQAFRQFQQTASSVWYAGPPRYDARPDLQARSADLRSLAQRVFGPKHLDAWPYSGPEVPRAGDNVHFGLTGGRVWAEGLLRDWQSALRGAGTVALGWLGPVAFGVAGAFAVGAWAWSRR